MLQDEGTRYATERTQSIAKSYRVLCIIGVFADVCNVRRPVDHRCHDVVVHVSPRCMWWWIEFTAAATGDRLDSDRWSRPCAALDPCSCTRSRPAECRSIWR